MNDLQFEHIRNQKFIALVPKLPTHIQIRAAKQFQILKENPLDPTLHFKKVSGLRCLRITDDYRVLGYKENGTIIWFWIGR